MQGIDIGQLLGGFLGEHVDRLAADIIVSDAVAYHDDPKIILPRGMSFSKAMTTLERLKKEQETPTEFQRKFLYRPNDGAYAAFQVLKDRYGMSMGKPQMTFFGLKPAETREVQIGVNQKISLPWGLIEVPVFPGLELYFQEVKDRDYGLVFNVYATGPKKYQDDMDSLFDAIEAYLKVSSIYRGNAIMGGDNPEFMDLSGFKRNEIVFSDEVEAQITGLLFAPIRRREAMEKEGISLKRSFLAYGPYGTGKSSLGIITAVEAVANGWTFISAKAGRDKPEDILRTARLYQPAVVFVEDIDTSTSSGEAEDVTRFLESFDGISSKGGKLIALMTTNHIEKIHKGMLRPGRLDGVIHIAELDRHGIERLVKAVVDGDKLAGDVDYDKVAEAMEGFLPAFVRDSITRSQTFAIEESGGKLDYTITTESLVNAALSLRVQYDLLTDADEGVLRPTLDKSFRELVVAEVTEAVNQFVPQNNHGMSTRAELGLDPKPAVKQ